MDNKLKNHPLVKNYLDQVCAQLNEKNKKSEIREEILSHFESYFEFEFKDDPKNKDKLLNKLNDSDIQKALEKFGDPKTLGKSLRQAQKTWPNRMLSNIISTTAVGFFLLYFSSLYFIDHYNDILNQFNHKVSLRFSRFENDQKDLAPLTLLKETTNVYNDAGRYLNHRIQWGHQNFDSEIQIPELQNSNWSREWLTQNIPKDFKNVNLAWIKKLKDFDHWDLFAHGPNSRFLGEIAEVINPFSAPIPDLGFLLKAAQLHLRRGLDTHNIIPALEDIRHLARLCYTTETLAGSMMAVSLLKTERIAFDKALERKMIDPSDYKALDFNLLKKMKTTLWVVLGYADYSNPDILNQTFFRSSLWPVGSCAALSGAAQNIIMTSEFLNKKYPLEINLDDRLINIHRLFEKSKTHCRLTFQRQIIQNPQKYIEFILKPHNFSFSNSWLNNFDGLRFAYGHHIPFIRQSFGLELVTRARNDFTSLYERE